MRVPLSWLREYVDVPDIGAEEIARSFVRMGLEVEAVHVIGADLSGPLRVGEVLEIEELTGFKKPIRYCQVRVDGVHGIVCGATNFTVGDRVALALPGAKLPGGFEISARSTYGHVSDGMICSARELGLGEEHTGILVLPPGSEVGADAVEVLELADTVVELAITPDRGYCLSVRGLARELAHGLGTAFSDPAAGVARLPAGAAPYDVRVADPVGCDRFVSAAVEGLDPTRPSPLWLTRRLALAGVRAISLAVDVTNYVMLELGQPMHAFDRARLSGPVVVRRGESGERLVTLDGVERRLHPEDLLITDDSGPIGLAAVMGGAPTEVTAATSEVLLEAAHWDPVSVARSARRYKLPSEAAKRFERGVDPEMTVVGVARAARLLVEYGGGRATGVLDVDHRLAAAPLALPEAHAGEVAGVPYPPGTTARRLREIGCAVSGDQVLTVTPPSWRPDLTDPIDLVEEVIRLDGYHNVPSVLPVAPAGRGLSTGQRRRRSIGRALAEAGYVEAPAYPFVDPAVHDTFGLADDDPRRVAVRLSNPISEQEPELRTSLLPGLLRTLGRNLARGQRDVALFELGLVFLPVQGAPPAPRLGVDRRPDEAELEALLAAVPHQPWYAGVVLTGRREPAGWWGPGREVTWGDAVQAARTVASAAGIEVSVRAGQRAPWHPGRCATLLAGGLVVGHAGELHPGVLAARELPRGTCAMELDLDALPVPGLTVAAPMSTYPPALLDVALVVPEDVPAADVRSAIAEGAGELLESVRLFDVYTGGQVGAGRRSLAYALTFRAADRTLTVEETTAARDAAVAEAARRTGAVLR